MKALTRIVAAVTVLALLVAGGYRLVQNRRSVLTADQADGFAQTVAVQQGELTSTISVVGEMYAPQSAALGFERVADTASLLNLSVVPGNFVPAGQVLATIDPTPFEQALGQALSDLQEAEKELVELQTPATALEIAQADLAIAQAQLALQEGRADLVDLTDPDVDALQTSVASAQLALTQAESDLLMQQEDNDYLDQLISLQETEADQYAEYSRLANETYSDVYYQDRLRLAHNDFLNTQDTRITAEIQQEVSLLQAQMQVRQAQQKLADAQEALAEAQAGPDELNLAVAQQAVAQAEADLAEAQEGRADLDEGADAVELAAAQADVDASRLAVTEAEADLVGATLVAPFAGTILETNAEPGDRITASSEVLTIANLDELQVIASVDETIIRQVETGQQASITFDAFPDSTFLGEVLSVPLQGTLQGGVMVYEVPISLEGAEELPLLVGMTANVEVAVGQAEDVLLVPSMALQQVGGLCQVLVPSSEPEGDPVAVPVETGLSNGTYTEIVRGLNAGDQVVVQLDSAGSDNFDMRAMRQLMGAGGGRR
jgi:HlyD family secretion protein